MAFSEPRGFSQLPTEILENICSNLCPHCTHLSRNRDRRRSWKALGALSKVSRRLQLIVQPILYHSIQGSKYVALLPLIRTLKERPDLAACTRQIVHNPETILHVKDATEFELLKDASRDLGLGDLAGVDFDRISRCDQIFTQILTAMTPNIETLRLSIGNGDKTNLDFPSHGGDSEVVGGSCVSMREDGFRSMVDVEFPNLRHLQFETAGAEGFIISHCTIGPILQAAPSIEQLIFKRSRFLDDSPRSLPSVVFRSPGLRHVRALEFQACAFSDDGRSLRFLRSLVKKCAKLEHFRIRSGRQSSSMSDRLGLHFPAPRVLQILARYQTQLKSLDINLINTTDTTSIENWNNSRVYVDPEILRQFTCLETLKLGEESFCSHRRNRRDKYSACLSTIIPQSVKSLVIRLFDDSRAWHDLYELADHAWAGLFPNLKQVTVYYAFFKRQMVRQEFQRRIREGREKLEQIYEQAGILLSVQGSSELLETIEDDVLGIV